MDDFESPPQGAIVVFGSNLRGAHFQGAALTAKRFYGALHGRGKGLMNGRYALPIKDEKIRTLTFSNIDWRANRFF